MQSGYRSTTTVLCNFAELCRTQSWIWCNEVSKRYSWLRNHFVPLHFDTFRQSCCPDSRWETLAEGGNADSIVSTAENVVDPFRYLSNLCNVSDLRLRQLEVVACHLVEALFGTGGWMPPATHSVYHSWGNISRRRSLARCQDESTYLHSRDEPMTSNDFWSRRTVHENIAGWKDANIQNPDIADTIINDKHTLHSGMQSNMYVTCAYCRMLWLCVVCNCNSVDDVVWLGNHKLNRPHFVAFSI